MKTITLQQLIDKDACKDQVELFKKTFGDSVEVTRELAIKYAQYFDFIWAADNLLDAPAWKIYKETIAPALKLYKETTAPAWKLYKETSDTASKLYEETIAPAWKLFVETRAPALKLYYETIAPAFVEAYLGMEKMD